MTSKLYLFDDPEGDRARLLLQSELFREYLREHAPQFLPAPPRRILDLGCGDGHLTLMFHELYPDAELIGIDRSPTAIEAARRQPDIGPNVSFVVGDIEEALPPGPFDLIYTSLVMVHVRDLTHIIELVTVALAPGGTFWVKDLHIDLVAASSQPDYQYLSQITLEAQRRAGAHPYVAAELPPLLISLGYTNVRQYDEAYPLGGPTVDGEVCLTNAVAVFRTARKFISRLTGISEAEILRRCDALVAAGQDTAATYGSWLNVNLLAQAPVAAPAPAQT